MAEVLNFRDAQARKILRDAAEQAKCQREIVRVVDGGVAILCPDGVERFYDWRQAGALFRALESVCHQGGRSG